MPTVMLPAKISWLAITWFGSDVLLNVLSKVIPLDWLVCFVLHENCTFWSMYTYSPALHSARNSLTGSFSCVSVLCLMLQSFFWKVKLRERNKARERKKKKLNGSTSAWLSKNDSFFPQYSFLPAFLKIIHFDLKKVTGKFQIHDCHLSCLKYCSIVGLNCRSTDPPWDSEC